MRLATDTDTGTGTHTTVIRVYLSERNLRALLAKLERPGSARTIMLTGPTDTVLFVTAESDDEHYTDREPGPVHPKDRPRMPYV